MKSAPHILAIALAAAALLAGAAHAMPAHDVGHWTTSTANAGTPSSDAMALVVSARRGPLAV